MKFSRRALLAAPLATLGTVQREVPEDFTGLSFETAELLPGSLLTPANTPLIALVRRLGQRGVIRLGGNSSDRARAHPSDAAVAALGGFLRATGWSLLYGLDLGNGTAEQAGREAATVAAAVGPALIAFQVGNEPDLFRHRLRPPSWGFADYLAAWKRFADAVLKRLPAARFAGPDVASRGLWMMPFATEANPRPAILTRHYYALGPGSSPAVTIPRLLSSGPELDASLVLAEHAARATGLPLRMAETNSVFGGGRVGVSNTLAAACWGAELMFRLAARGWAGVNFHDRPDRSYAPVGRTTPLAKPLYYGMLLYATANPRDVANLPVITPLRGYRIAGRDGRSWLAFFNLDSIRSHRATLPAAAQPASLLRLAGPSAASSSVMLGGASVADDGTWRPRLEQPRAPIVLAPASGALIELA